MERRQEGIGRYLPIAERQRIVAGAHGYRELGNELVAGIHHLEHALAFVDDDVIALRLVSVNIEGVEPFDMIRLELAAIVARGWKDIGPPQHLALAQLL